MLNHRFVAKSERSYVQALHWASLLLPVTTITAQHSRNTMPMRSIHGNDGHPAFISTENTKLPTAASKAPRDVARG